MAKGLRLGALVWLVLTLVGCDHATKFAAEHALAGGPARAVVPGVLDLAYAPNHGIAFSALRDVAVPEKRWVLVATSAFALVAILVLAFRRRKVATKVELVAWAAIVAGALGNVLDRASRGYVVDFLRLPHWPIFNLADVFIVLGGLALLVSSGILRSCASHTSPDSTRSS